MSQINFDNVKVFVFENTVDLNTGSTSVQQTYYGKTGNEVADSVLANFMQTQLQKFATQVFNNPSQYTKNQQVSSVTFPQTLNTGFIQYGPGSYELSFNVEYIKSGEVTVTFYLTSMSIYPSELYGF